MISTFETATRANDGCYNGEYWELLTFGNGTGSDGASHNDGYWIILLFGNGTKTHGDINENYEDDGIGTLQSDDI